MALTVLLPENPYSRELLALLTPLLPPDSQIRDPDAGLEGLDSGCCLLWHWTRADAARAGIGC